MKLMKVMDIDRDKNYLIDDESLLKNATSVNMLALILVCYRRIWKHTQEKIQMNATNLLSNPLDQAI